MSKPTINLIDFRKYPSMCPDYDMDRHIGPNAEKPKECLKVESLKGTIDYVAGSFITELTVKDLIGFKWNVNVRQPRNNDLQ